MRPTLTPIQKRLERAVKGSILNAMHGHPEWRIDTRFISSITKRAVGTLSSQWQEIFLQSQAKEIIIKVYERVEITSYELQKGIIFLRHGRKTTYVKTLGHVIGSMARDARKEGNVEREKAFVDILRMMNKSREEKRQDIPQADNSACGDWPQKRSE